MPYDPTDYITASLNGKDLKSQYSPEQDFQPLPQYSQTRISNATYTNVTTTRTDPDGSTTQSLQIISKRWGE
jgi:hypothetical protein